MIKFKVQRAFSIDFKKEKERLNPMRKYLSLGSALMFGVVQGKDHSRINQALAEHRSTNEIAKPAAHHESAVKPFKKPQRSPSPDHENDRDKSFISSFASKSIERRNKRGRNGEKSF